MAKNLDVLAERIANFQGETFRRLDEIHAQTLKTNGRVNKLELGFAILKGKASILGIVGGSIAAIIVGVVTKKIL